MKKIALVCDWLTTVGGAESVLLALHKMYPEAPIYTSKYNKKGIDWFNDADVRTGWLQVFPNCLRRFISPLRQYYFSHLDLTNYDLVISVTGAEAKSIKASKHICYCHVPTQYYWGMYDDYINNPGFGILNPIARLGLKLFVKPLRKKDYAAAQKPDVFVTISSYAKEQIKKYYNREAEVIFPPVDIDKFSTTLKKFSTSREIKSQKSQASEKHNYITTSRQVNWKRLDLCVKAALKTGVNLTIIGNGPEHKNLIKMSNGSKQIKFLPTMSQDELRKYLADADGFLFPSLEPFGLAPIEAMACGTPVIAYAKGGALDYIKPGVNGEFFEKQTVNSLAAAIESFEPNKYNSNVVKNTTLDFDKKYFCQKMQHLVERELKNE
ncbi:glycosyltransferase [Candidatus Saccharibacteria bacterium]|nr:glycosyltransferase [Candidatus Saccharibacteria bacterium]